MFFYLQYSTAQPGRLRVERREGVPESSPADDNVLLLCSGKQQQHELESPHGRLILLGDPVFRDQAELARQLAVAPGMISEECLYEAVLGHYYWFFITAEGLRCGASFGGLFPLYYLAAADRAYACSSAFYLAQQQRIAERDSRYVLERLLFNYPFFDSTWWAPIKRLEAHRCLCLDAGGLRQEGRFALSDYFGAPSGRANRSLERLVELFAVEAPRFFPEAPFAVSLTGGFDGRTLAAAARQAGRAFSAYCFGRPGSSDLSLSAAAAQQAGIPFWPISLGQAYLEDAALTSARAFMRLSEYDGNFGRPHYHYAAEQLGQKTGYIITGNFGSELFRSLHLPGAMMSEGLIRLFSAPDSAWKDYLRGEARQWLGPSLEADALEELLEDLEAYLAAMAGWTPNQKFYHFVFNEIFRKYFGPELLVQSHFLNNRTPYLNFRFFRELCQTAWSGVHSELFEKRKRLRMKGQLFYGAFLRQADPVLYRLPTNKGYQPADVTESWRLPLLAAKAVLKKLRGAKEYDENNVYAFFQANALDLLPSGAGETEAWAAQGLSQARADIAEGRRLDKWIKYYSIAAGWDAAGQPALLYDEKTAFSHPEK